LGDCAVAKIVEINTVTIYALYSSASINNVRYIGYTEGSLPRRLSHHISASTDKTHRVADWIRKEIARGRKIHIVPLEINTTKNSESKWISLFSLSGADLLNCNAGCSRKVVENTGSKPIIAKKAVLSPAAAWPFSTSSRP
jgi:GIY-YIG catalytic domain